MLNIFNSSFTEDKYNLENAWVKTNALPDGMHIERAQTQTDVNKTVLNYLAQKFNKDAPLTILELPCGRQEFAGYMKQLLPQSNITAVDIVPTEAKPGLQFRQMDLSNIFTIPVEPQFDLITSLSGIMMFGNTKLFVESCIKRLKTGGTFIITDDNAATLKDKLTFLLFGNLRMFPAVYSDKEEVTQNVSIQELVRLLRINKVEIKDIQYTSHNWKDYLLFPLAVPVYLLQRLFLRKFSGSLPPKLIKKMYPFKHLYCRHYIFIAEKRG